MIESSNFRLKFLLLVQSIRRTLNCLSDQDHPTRKRALQKLQVCLLKDDGAGSLPPMDVLQVIKKRAHR